MNDEKELNLNNDESSGGRILIEILYALRSHLLLIIVVTLLFTAGGFAYSKIRKPVYTANVSAQFTVEIEGSGNTVDQYSSTNYVFSYFKTAVDLCKKGGVVIDRANRYYAYYQDEHKRDGITIDEFIAKLSGLYETVKKDRQEIPGYEVDEAAMSEYRNKWFKSSNVGANYVKSADSGNTTTIFSMWVKNLNRDYAREMALIYALASDVSLNMYLDFGSATDVSTAGINVFANRVSDVSVSQDVSATRIVVIAFIIGLLLAAITAYILHIADTSVTTKEQLEEITGANLIAYIDELAEVR